MPSFYRLQQMIKYKAKLLGVPVLYVKPHYTSQHCLKCKYIGERDRKKFYCKRCKWKEHADVNAAMCIALRGAGKL